MNTIAFSSSLGWVGVVVNQSKVIDLTFGHRSKVAAQSCLNSTARLHNLAFDGNAESPLLESLTALFRDYADGLPVDFRGIKIDQSNMAAFQRRVIQICRRIPYGETLSYGEVARRAGSPLAARAVGNVMARNRVPLIVPCHRVVASGGRLGGFSAVGGVRTKLRLLEMESSGRLVS